VQVRTLRRDGRESAGRLRVSDCVDLAAVGNRGNSGAGTSCGG